MFLSILLATTIRVSAAASLTDALREIAGPYQKQSGHSLLFNLGASSMLARQIEQGAPADLFISADELRMDELQRRGLIVPRSRRSILSNTLVIIIPSDSARKISSPQDLIGRGIRHIALAEPRTINLGEKAPVFRVEVFGRKPTVEDVLGPKFWIGPVPYGGMTHQEFMDMVTPKEVRPYAGFSSGRLAEVVGLGLIEQWALRSPPNQRRWKRYN